MTATKEMATRRRLALALMAALACSTLTPHAASGTEARGSRRNSVRRCAADLAVATLRKRGIARLGWDAEVKAVSVFGRHAGLRQAFGHDVEVLLWHPLRPSRDRIVHVRLDPSGGATVLEKGQVVSPKLLRRRAAAVLSVVGPSGLWAGRQMPRGAGMVEAAHGLFALASDLPNKWYVAGAGLALLARWFVPVLQEHWAHAEYVKAREGFSAAQGAQ